MLLRRVFFILLLVERCTAPPTQVSNIEANLTDTLSSQYPGSGLARPMVDFDSPFLTVNISMLLSDFDDLDDISGLLTMSGQVRARWTDQNLKWNASEYSSINKVQLRSANIWLPPVVQYNYAPDCATPLFSQGGADSLSTVWVRQDGEVVAVHAGELITSCDIDLSYFPFDSQTCSYLYTTYAYTDEYLHFMPGSISFIDTTPDPSGVWAVESYSCTQTVVTTDFEAKDETYSAVECSFVFQRRPSWFLLNFFAPAVLIACLQLSSFFMPLGEGRTSFCMTVVLAFSVFQTVTSTLLPKTSSSVPLVNYLMIQTAIGSAATLNSIYVFYLYQVGKTRGKKVPKCLRCVLRLYGVDKDSDETREEKLSLKPLTTKGQIERSAKELADRDVAVNIGQLPFKGLPRRAETFLGSGKEGGTVAELQARQAFYTDVSKMIAVMARRQLRQIKDDNLENSWLCIAHFFDTIVCIICLIVTGLSTGFLFCPTCLPWHTT